jgi:CRISPR-associated protein Cas1
VKRLLNTLYVTTQGAYLHRDGQSAVVEIEGAERLRVPLHNLQGIVCFGNVLCSPFLLGACAEQHVAVSFLTAYGRFLASVHGEINGNVLLRREQGRRADSVSDTAAIIRALLAGKLANARATLRRAAREGAGDRAGRARLRRVAKACLDYGQRVQNSVFECLVDPAQWTALRARLKEIFDPAQDSLRFYYLGSNWQRRVEHHGTKASIDMEDDTLLV